MKEQFGPSEQNNHQAPETLVPNVLARLGLEGLSINRDASASPVDSIHVHNWQLRTAMLESLSGQGKNTNIEPLLTALSDEDASVRAVAVRVLGRMDVGAARVKLENALLDADWHVRETAVFALGQSISPSVELLMVALHDEDAGVREAATMMLQEIRAEGLTIQPLPNDDTTHVYATRLLGKVSVYKNIMLTHIQGVDDRIVRRERYRLNKLNTLPNDQIQRKQRPMMRVLEGLMAVVIVLGLAGSWFALARGVRTSTQGHSGTIATQKGSLFYQQDEMTPAIYWTSNSKYIYVHDKRDTLLHFINVETKHITTITNPEIVSQTIPGKIAALTPDGLSVCTIDDTGVMLHVQVQTVLTKEIQFDASYPKIMNIDTGISPHWSNDGTRITVSSSDGTITLLNVKTKQQPVVLKGPSNAYNIAWSRDDKQLLVTMDDGNNGLVFLWNTTTGQRALALTVPSYATSTYSVQLSPDGTHILLVPNDLEIQILDAKTGAKVFTYSDITDSQNVDVVWLDNARIISISENIAPDKQHVQIWNAFTGRTTLDVPIATNSRWSTSYNNKYIVVKALDGTTTQVWNAITGHKVATHTSSSIYLPSSSPNGKFFLTTTGGDGNKIDIWSAITGKTVAIYQSSDSSVVLAMWSPDGKYLLSIGTDGRDNPTGTTLDLWRMPGLQ